MMDFVFLHVPNDLKKIQLSSNSLIPPQEPDHVGLLGLGFWCNPLLDGTSCKEGEGNLTSQKFRSLKDQSENVVEDIFGDCSCLQDRAILCPKNVEVSEMNEHVLCKLQGVPSTFLSNDSLTEENDRVRYPQEFLNSVDIGYLPPHRLNVKIGAPVRLAIFPFRTAFPMVPVFRSWLSTNVFSSAGY